LSFSVIETVASGLFVASAFPIGALIAVSTKYSTFERALFASFGAGIFFAAVVLLVQETLNLGNYIELLVGFILGALSFGIAQHYLKHDDSIQNKKQAEGKLTIIGTILDSVPETSFIGIIIALHEPGLVPALIVLFLGNLATTLEGAKVMHEQKLSKKKILRDWLLDFVIVAIAAPIGYELAHLVAKDILSIFVSFAIGTLMVFIASELIAGAYKQSTGHWADISLSLGFIVGIMSLFVV
jgi:hypothetical protein